MRNEELYNRFGRERIASRQIDELIGLAKGLCADGVLNQAEIEFLQKWLAANADITGSVILAELYSRVAEVLSDGIVDRQNARICFRRSRTSPEMTLS